MEMNNIDQMLQSFRSDLPRASKTAAAIDQGASLEEISELAEEEGLHKIATVLFEAEQEALRKGPERAEDAATRPATEIVPQKVVQTLYIWRHPEEAPKPDWSIRDFTLALGRLGGHQNRRSDGMPGWITLWRGYERLAIMLDFRKALQRAERITKDVG